MVLTADPYAKPILLRRESGVWLCQTSLSPAVPVDTSSKEDLREKKLLFSLKSLHFTMLLILSEKSFREKDLVISDIKEQSDIKESAK